jgi:hypothetical protein
MNRFAILRRSLRTVAALAAVGTFAIGCKTMNDVVMAKNANEGTTRVHPASCDDAYNLALAIFRAEGAEAIEEHRAEGYMLTSSGAGLVSFGTLMGAWFEPAAQKTSCTVTCVTKRKVATNAITTLTETTFHERMAEAIARKAHQ